MNRVATLTRQQFFSDVRAPISIRRMPRQGHANQHRHEFFEIVVVLSGSGIHVIGSFRHRIGKGDVLFLDRYRTHGYEETRGLNLLNLLVSEDALVRIGRELADCPGYHALFSLNPERDTPSRQVLPRQLRLTSRELEQIEEWAARIEELARPRGSRPSRMLEETYLTLMIDVLSRRYERSTPASTSRVSAPSGSTSRVRLGRILSLIETNLAQPLHLKDLAAAACMSERTFLRSFRAAVGVSPHAYIMRVRLTSAAQCLASPSQEKSVTEIAQDCGFNDSNYFARAFRRFAQTSPTAYRKASKERRRKESPSLTLHPRN